MRIVQTTSNAKYLKLVPENSETIDSSKYLNVKLSKKSPVVEVEDNLTNRIVLNWNVPQFSYLPIATADQQRLLNFQVNDVQKLLGLPNGLNLNPMGLGKTIETIIMLKNIEAKNGVIVVPKTIIPQWIAKLKEWWPEFKGDFISYETKRTPVTPNNIYLVNYAKFLNVDTQRLFRSFIWDFLAVDEVHNLKSPKSKSAAEISMLPRKKFFGLTGSPILNKPNDLWNLLYMCDPFYAGGSYWDFTEYYCNIEEGPFGKRITGLTTDEFHIETLHKLLNIVSVRNNVKVAPPKTIITVPLKMEPKQRKLYRDAKNLLIDQLPPNLTVLSALSLGTRLLQLTSWPGLFEGYEDVDGIKFLWIKEFLENCDGNVVIFTKFKTTAIALGNYLNRSDCCTGCLTYHGEMTVEQRYDTLKRFGRDGRGQVLVGTIGSLGVGVDGLQDVCRIAIFVEREWSPKMNEQCEERLCRPGQEYPVLCYYLECEQSWDQHVGRINLNKSEDIRKVLIND